MGNTVLLVACERLLCRLANAILIRDYHVDTVTALEQALRAIDAQPYAVLVMEFSPIGPHSWEVLQRVWAHPACPPVVILTTDTSKETHQRLLDLGVAKLVYMPFSIDALRRAIDGVLSHDVANSSAA